MLNLIDGYNFIFKIPRLERAAETDTLEKAREELISLLARYKLISGQDFTVVFDGREQAVAPPGVSKEKYTPGHLEQSIVQGIKVIFSKATTADEDIISLLQGFPNPKEITVVTSDNAILRAARSHGCPTAPPEEFYKKITRTLKKEKFGDAKEPGGKYQDLQEHEVKYWLKYFKDRLGEGGVKGQ
jgi:predicted RNA-binding protein with PIN domain